MLFKKIILRYLLKKKDEAFTDSFWGGGHFSPEHLEYTLLHLTKEKHQLFPERGRQQHVQYEVAAVVEQVDVDE